MENTVQLKCTCGHCGGVIDYPAVTAGRIVECPHCQERSRLPEVDTPNPAVPDEPGEKATPPVCAVCGSPLTATMAGCQHCAARQGRRKLLWALGSAFGLLCLGWITLTLLNHPSPAPRRRSPAGSTTLLAPPTPKPPKSPADLKPGGFQFVPRQGNVPAYATGRILNASDYVHRGVWAYLDVLDARGAKIGTISDTSIVIAPRQTWQFIANVSDPRAASVRFASLKEDQ